MVTTTRHARTAHVHGHDAMATTTAMHRPRMQHEPVAATTTRTTTRTERTGQPCRRQPAAADLAGLAGPAGGRLLLFRRPGSRGRGRLGARRSSGRRLAGRPAAPEPGARRPGRGGAGRRRLARDDAPASPRSTTGCCRPAKPASCACRPSRWAARWSNGCATAHAATPRAIAALRRAASPTYPVAFALAAARSRRAARDDACWPSPSAGPRT